MPVGRFRDDPRELGEREREIFARQHAEGALVVGSLLGTAIPLGLQVVPLGAPAILTSPIAVILGVLGGGVAGYLVGHAYRERRRRALDVSREAGAEQEDRASRTRRVAADGDAPASNEGGSAIEEGRGEGGSEP